MPTPPQVPEDVARIVLLHELANAIDDRDRAAARVDSLALSLREAGATWTQIGLALGVSRQAALARYRHRS